MMSIHTSQMMWAIFIIIFFLVSFSNSAHNLHTNSSVSKSVSQKLKKDFEFYHVEESTNKNTDLLHASSQGNSSQLHTHSIASGADGDKATSMIEKIFLWTPSHKSGKEYELLVLGDNSSITNSHFQKRHPTYIIVHGFLGDGLEPWILDTKHKLLALHDCNVISVQWPSGSAYFVIDYYHVAGHVPVVGKEIAQLLTQLQQLKALKNSHVHIIGHSLGAHIAGFVGKNVDSILARISGLDPAGLSFRGRDASQRLDKTDAQYVDVIHTNGCLNYLVWTDCFGIDTAVGHTDFWPNGGRHQPACRGWLANAANTSDNTGVNGSLSGSWSVGCDHMMSHTYFVESLDYSPSSGLFLSRPCTSYDEYEAGNCSCGAVPQYMGYFADKRALGNFYLNTSADPPYALPDHHCPTSAHAALSELSVSLCFLVLVLALCLLLHMAYSCCRHYVGRKCCGYQPMPDETDGVDRDGLSGSCRSNVSVPATSSDKIVVVL